VPRGQLEAELKDPQYDDWEFGRQRGTPYAMRRRVLKGHLGAPCLTPPWGRLTAVDMVHGTIKWQIPLGDAPVLGGLLHFNVGMPVIGGPMITAGGLVFIAASLKDDRFRAFDLETGKLLWDDKLPAGGQATPMTYSLGGRQFVVIAAGGYKGDTTRGDYVIAYALPQ